MADNTLPAPEQSASAQRCPVESQTTVPAAALAAEIRSALDRADVRAVIVADDGPGSLVVQTISRGVAVLNIAGELKEHLDEGLYSDEWLAQLRDYCIGRLAARAEARRSGGLAIAHGWGWEIRHGDGLMRVVAEDA